jgi:hypothetical protein
VGQRFGPAFDGDAALVRLLIQVIVTGPCAARRFYEGTDRLAGGRFQPRRIGTRRMPKHRIAPAIVVHHHALECNRPRDRL